ncbi:MAG TPA: hypothetical protein VH855_21430, partial [Acetobacteraceae bacterium]
MRIINTSTVGPIVLKPADNPLIVTSTGTVTSASTAINASATLAGGTWNISNAGSIIASGTIGGGFSNGAGIYVAHSRGTV